MEIRRSYDRLISTIGFPILVRWHLYIEQGPSHMKACLQSITWESIFVSTDASMTRGTLYSVIHSWNSNKPDTDTAITRTEPATTRPVQHQYPIFQYGVFTEGGKSCNVFLAWWRRYYVIWPGPGYEPAPGLQQHNIPVLITQPQYSKHSTTIYPLSLLQSTDCL